MHSERPGPEDPNLREREQLATMLALMLLITVGGAFFLFLIFVTLGLFFWVLVMGAAIAAFAGLHYLMWGRNSKGNTADDSAEDTSTGGDLARKLLDHRRKEHQD